MAALSTVADYVADVRVLLQDVISPYRYTDAEMVSAINVVMMDVRRVRPDLMLGDGTTTYFDDPPTFSAVNSDVVPIDFQFRPAIVYGICGYAIMRDQEDIQDNRARGFMGLFQGKLLTTSI